MYTAKATVHRSFITSYLGMSCACGSACTPESAVTAVRPACVLVCRACSCVMRVVSRWRRRPGIRYCCPHPRRHHGGKNQRGAQLSVCCPVPRPLSLLALHLPPASFFPWALYTLRACLFPAPLRTAQTGKASARAHTHTHTHTQEGERDGDACGRRCTRDEKRPAGTRTCTGTRARAMARAPRGPSVSVGGSARQQG